MAWRYIDTDGLVHDDDPAGEPYVAMADLIGAGLAALAAP